MCESGGYIHSVCLKAETTVKEESSFKVMFITPYSLFSKQ